MTPHERTRNWARNVIRDARAAGPLPRFGEAEWWALRGDDPRRLGALVVAAEAWRQEYGPQRIAQRLRGGLWAERYVEEKLADKDFAHVARRVRDLANVPTIEERIDRGYIARRLDLPPALPRSWWTAEEAARERQREAA